MDPEALVKLVQYGHPFRTRRREVPCRRLRELFLFHEDATTTVGAQRHTQRRAVLLGARPATAPVFYQVHRVCDDLVRDGDVEPVSTPRLGATARVEALDDASVAIRLARAWRLVTAAGVVQLAASVFAGAVGVGLYRRTRSAVKGG